MSDHKRCRTCGQTEEVSMPHNHVPRTPVFVPHRAGHTPAEDHAGFIDGCPACARWQSFLTERKARIEETGE